jgi:CHAT domain-containing protein
VTRSVPHELSSEFVQRYLATLGVERALTNLATINARIGQYRLAVEQYQQALALFPATDAPAGAKSALEGLAEVYRALGDPSRASQYERRAAQSSSAQLLSLASVRGGTLALNGTPADSAAMSTGEQSNTLSMFAAPGHRPRDGSNAVRQALDFEKRGDPLAAAASFTKAAMIADEVGSPDDQRYIYFNLQRFYATRSQPEVAIFYGKRAVNAVQRLRTNLSSMDLDAKKTFLADNRSLYQTLADLLMGSQRLAEAEQVLRMLKEDEGAELTQSRETIVYGRVPYTLVEAAFVKRFDTSIESLRAADTEYQASRSAQNPMITELNSHAGNAEARELRAQLDDARYTLSVLRRVSPDIARAEPPLHAAFDAELANANYALHVIEAKWMLFHGRGSFTSRDISDADLLHTGSSVDALLDELQASLIDPNSSQSQPEAFPPGYLANLERDIASLEAGVPKVDGIVSQRAAALRTPRNARTPQDRQMLQAAAMLANMVSGKLSSLTSDITTHRDWVARSPQLYPTSDRQKFASLDIRLTRLQAALAPLSPAADSATYGHIDPQTPATVRIDGEIVPTDPRTAGIFGQWVDGLALASDLTTLDRQHSQLDAELRTTTRPAPAVSDEDARYLDSQRQMIEKWQGVAAVYYLTLEDRVRILAVTTRGRVSREFPIGRAALSEKIASYRRTLQVPGRDPLPQARDLYETLMQPVVTELNAAGIHTVMLSLDGNLRYLPFSALYDGKRWLVERFALDLYTASAPDALRVTPQPHWSIAAFGNSAGGQGLPSLPAVRGELAGIVGDSQTRGQRALPDKMFLDGQFTATTLKSVLKQHYPVIHIASHFVFRPGDAAGSFLLLGDGQELSLATLKTGGYRFDGVDLLSLSACETALDSSDGYGQEIDGLGALAQSQGAAAVLATLWSVADASTGIFMRSLYDLRESRSLSRAEAVREAQLEFIHGATSSATDSNSRGAKRLYAPGLQPQPDTQHAGESNAPYAHPFYWAPFILMGNWL